MFIENSNNITDIADYFLHLESLRNDGQKNRPLLSNGDDNAQPEAEDEAVDLHNDR